jgi:hypothetical protein
VKRLGVVGIALLILHPSPIVNFQRKVIKKKRKKKKKKKEKEKRKKDGEIGSWDTWGRWSVEMEGND